MTALLLDHLWQSTAVAAIVGAIALVCRRQPASLRYALWCAASAKFLIPFALLVWLGARLPWPRAIGPAARATLVTVNLVGAPFAGDAPRSVSFAADSAAAVDLGMLLLAGWALGAAAILAVAGRRWAAIARASRRAAPLRRGEQPRLADALAEVTRSASHRLPIRLTARTFEPGVFGIFKPVLLWPEGLTERLSDEEIRSVLAHELAHVRRRDNAVAALQMMVQATFWFHPLVWWIGSRLIAERELACDEHVVSRGHEREAYAQGILKICRFSVEQPLACVAGVTGGDLKQRIMHVVTMPRAGSVSRLATAALTAATAIGVCAPVAIGAIQAARSSEPMPDPRTAISGPAFDVAAIKLNTSGDPGSRLQTQPNGRLRAVNVSLKTLIRGAYRVQDAQIAGGPDWFDSARFDIDAAPPDGSVPAPPEVAAMIRQLVAARFKLEAHIERREESVYTLVAPRGVTKLGAQLKPNSVDCAAEARKTPAPAASGGPPPVPPCGLRTSFGTLSARAIPMSQLASALSQAAGRAVVDRTNLTGGFDVDLSWTPDRLPPRAAGTASDQPVMVNGIAIDPNGPSLFTALQEQLGLKLEPAKVPIDVLVITNASKPAID